MKNGAVTYSIATLLVLSILSTALFMNMSEAQTPDAPILDPLTIPKFVNQLTGAPPVYVGKLVRNPNGSGFAMQYTVTMDESMQQILPPGYPKTAVWGYGGQAKDAVTGKSLGYVLNSPGPTFEAIRGLPTVVKWVNNINTPYMFPVDPTLHWANPNNIPMMDAIMQAGMMLSPPYAAGYNGMTIDGTNPYAWNAQSLVPLVTHLHGGEVQSLYDGGPNEWFTNRNTRPRLQQPLPH